ncbi:hypothetical protein Ppa06_57630 [Planomonospora parontospora subsp. parontospora]|uniref:Uncharacterized protein n=2 Tax=Planomonospora parontospora TaxID=58119 RepID=A0AA37F772_9ACTN|nr:hypothetical protein [Planomonospora parontospora]GGK90706.1 hypothetical protein GCM10010126_57680 [Planomonospora parontospora]GII11965.1 hypothetical protein Ppa06_57630 [Planomonospora parontospora subsp. parontospora]
MSTPLTDALVAGCRTRSTAELLGLYRQGAALAATGPLTLSGEVLAAIETVLIERDALAGEAR